MDIVKVQRRTASGLEDVGVLPLSLSDIVESGENANGRYTKWADGTMICWQGTFNHPVTFQSWASDTTNRQYI